MLVAESPASAGDGDKGSIFWVQKISEEGMGNLLPVFLCSSSSQARGVLGGCNPEGRRVATTVVTVHVRMHNELGRYDFVPKLTETPVDEC